MKTLSYIFGAFISGAIALHAQTNSAPPSWMSLMPQVAITNIATSVYGTHFDNNNKYGGGIVATYNFNAYAGTSIAADWAGDWKLFGGGLKLQYPVKWGAMTVTPFGLFFIQTPLSGASSDNGTLATAEGGGLNVSIYKKFSVGGGWVNRTSCGDFSGGSEFLSFTIRF